jgi:FtsP/CotA-like multicopper oxidase with cupredoxin domain
MGPPIRSKKMTSIHPGARRQLDLANGKWSASIMADPIFPLTRREFMAGLGSIVLGPAIALAEGRLSLRLQAKADAIALRSGAPETPIWSLGRLPSESVWRFKRGDTIEVALANQLPVPVTLNWRGLDGVPAAEPLVATTPLAPGTQETFAIPLRHAGTLLCDLRLTGDGQARPSSARALVVAESEAIAVDRDEVFLIEDWMVRPDGTAMAPGADPKDAMPLYSVNGRMMPEIAVRTHERLRLRLINGFQRHVIAIKLEDEEVRVMALDGQPSEPFPARNGALVLAPGARTDAFIDVTKPPGSSSAILLHDGKEARPIARLVVSKDLPVRNAPLAVAPPLPSNGLPIELDLRNATRIDLTLGGPHSEWVAPAAFTATARPVLKAKAGRTVVLALTNRADIATVFHLHGHHFRLLDRLDDGWKPFWLDTLAIEAGQTQRIAFSAEYAGRWLMEATAADWAAPRLVRWYSVE